VPPVRRERGALSGQQPPSCLQPRTRTDCPVGARSATGADRTERSHGVVPTARTIHTKLTGAYVDPAAGRVTLRTYAEQWRKMQVHRVSTAAQVETNLRRHVYPTFGDRALGSVRPSELQAWVRGRSDELSAGTVCRSSSATSRRSFVPRSRIG
jgi:Phage integrase, N-terminal SAM-like domain